MKHINIATKKKPRFPEEWIRLKKDYLTYHKFTLKHAKTTLENYGTCINWLYKFMLENRILHLADLTHKDIIKFQYHIYKTLHISTFRSINGLLITLSSFCRYLYHKDLIWKNPFDNIKYVTPREYENKEIKRYYNWEELQTRWTNWMKKKMYHIENVKNRLDSLQLFISFLDRAGIKTVYKIKPETLESYKKFLSTYQYKSGYTYSSHTQFTQLHNICLFLSYLYRESLIKQDFSRYLSLKNYFKEITSQYRSNQIPPNPMRDINARVDNPEICKLFNKFIQYHLSNGGSKGTVKGYLLAIEKFYSFISSRGITDLRKVGKRDIMDYQIWLSEQATIKGTKYAQNTLLNFFINLRAFFSYLTKYDYLVCDHTSNVDLPKGENALPHTCMTEREVQTMLNQPDTSKVIGLRDRAIMEVLYSTAIRANELAHIKATDIDFTQGLLRVEQPKGGKSYQRIVPIGRVACEYVKSYLTKVRPLLCRSRDKGYLFVSSTGKKLERSYLSCMIRKYLFHSGLRKKITTHSFRVSCATHMLLHKADIRYVQQQLGHISIRTTQGYTRLVPKDLKSVHRRCHPREKKHLDILV